MPAVTLNVYVHQNCWNCDEARRLASLLALEFSQVAIHCIDVVAGEVPDAVFATPTYLLNGELLFLGNPTEEQLRLALRQAVAAEKTSC